MACASGFDLSGGLSNLSYERASTYLGACTTHNILHPVLYHIIHPAKQPVFPGIYTFHVLKIMYQIAQSIKQLPKTKRSHILIMSKCSNDGKTVRYIASTGTCMKQRDEGFEKTLRRKQQESQKSPARPLPVHVFLLILLVSAHSFDSMLTAYPQHDHENNYYRMYLTPLSVEKPPVKTSSLVYSLKLYPPLLPIKPRVQTWQPHSQSPL